MSLDANISQPDPAYLSAKFLNTSFQIEGSRPSIFAFLDRMPKLGSYSVVEVSLAPRERVQIVVDQNIPWLQNSLNAYFSTDVKRLSLLQIEQYLLYLKQGKISKTHIPSVLGIAPHKNITKSKFLNIFYLDDIAHENSQQQLILCLLAQILLERFSRRESRIVALQELFEGQVTQNYLVLVKSQLREEVQILDPTNKFPRLVGRTINALSNLISLENGKSSYVEILPGEIIVTHPRFGWNEREKSFSIFTGNGKEILFYIIGRSTAEKRFKAEELEISLADENSFVPIEIGFHPFWRRLGHTTIRIGEALYELSSHGWRRHHQGSNSARAYLYNNPFFKQQYQLYREAGMSPVSIAVNVQVLKSQAMRLRDIMNSLSEAEGREREKFSLFRNNCNQGIMRVLEMAGVPGFTSSGYMGFSSILSFRSLLLYPVLPVNAYYIYPLPGSAIHEANLRKWIPRLLYRHNTVVQEMFRALPSLAWDAISFGMRRLSDYIFEKFKVRLWRGNQPYFMH